MSQTLFRNKKQILEDAGISSFCSLELFSTFWRLVMKKTYRILGPSEPRRSAMRTVVLILIIYGFHTALAFMLVQMTAASGLLFWIAVGRLMILLWWKHGKNKIRKTDSRLLQMLFYTPANEPHRSWNYKIYLSFCLWQHHLNSDVKLFIALASIPLVKN